MPNILPIIHRFLATGLLLALLMGCEETEGPDPSYQWGELGRLGDPSWNIPMDNPMTSEKVALGKRLFFDPILSSDRTVSCASCHVPEKAFADPRRVSTGVAGRKGTRNSPALINLVYKKDFFWHGSSPGLEQQVLLPITAENEMNSSLEEVIRRLNGDPEYVAAFRQTFGTAPDVNTLTDAIASFERSLISNQSPFDHYMAGDSNAMTAAQIRGMQLFRGEKAECFHCHEDPYFNSLSFENNGLYEEYEDPGRWEVTGKESDKGKFMVPTLRNIEHTAPYMHDGSLHSLEEVIDHYSSGGKNHPNKSGFIRRFILSPQEKSDLIAFLQALSDPVFINDPDNRP